VGAILKSYDGIQASDGIHFFYGEKIDGRWYFWTGAYLVIPRDVPSNTIRKSHYLTPNFTNMPCKKYLEAI